MIVVDECYLLIVNGYLFFIGNYLVEILLLMYYLDKVGFDIDVVMLFGNVVKFEWWVFLYEDCEIGVLYECYQVCFCQLLQLDEVVVGLGVDLDYVVIFIFGGYGVLIGLLESVVVKVMLQWVMVGQCYIIMFCYGLVVLLVVGVDEVEGDLLFCGYCICVFFDVMDWQILEIGYMLGQLCWFFGECLVQQGVQIVNEGIDGSVLQDWLLLIGDSLLVGNVLGKLVVCMLFDVLVGC